MFDTARGSKVRLFSPVCFSRRPYFATPPYMTRMALSLVAVVLLVSPAAAQGSPPQSQFAKVKSIQVTVADKVADGCLPQPNTLKVEAELILRRSGIAVVETGDGFPHRLRIAAVGAEIKQGGTRTGGCAGGYVHELFRHEYLSDGSIGLTQAVSVLGYAIKQKSDFQEQLRKAVNENVTMFANEILKARQK